MIIEEYLRDHIVRMEEAIDDGVEMIGYLIWSATDLYSTREGFQKRYGFVSINEKTMECCRRKFFYWYKGVIESNGESLENN